MQYLDSDYSLDCDSGSTYCRRRYRTLRRIQELTAIRQESSGLRAQSEQAVALVLRGICTSALPPDVQARLLSVPVMKVVSDGGPASAVAAVCRGLAQM